MPPWYQQQGQQPQQPQQQQALPYQSQQGQYGQFSPQGQGYGQYGQYGSPPLGYGQQGQHETQMVEQGETVSAVKEALGTAWKGILGFGSRTKEVAEQARDTVVAKAAAAGQTIGTTSQGTLF
jgi:hypothetical protein